MTAIIVLNWNSCEMTAECTRSLLAMDAKDFEIVVVDNGSLDGSVEYLSSLFPDVTVIANERNLGFAAGCNIGLRTALSRDVEYALLVNNDTVVDSRLLENLLDEAERHPEAGMVSPKIFYYDYPDRLWWGGGTYTCSTGIPTHVGLKRKDSGMHDAARDIDWGTGCVLLIRAKVLHKVGFFDEQLFGNGEDVDLSLRMRSAGYSIRYTPLAKVWHKEGVDYKKNAGEYVRKFTASRNLLWLVHKHGRASHWVTFVPNFCLRFVLPTVIGSVIRGDLRSAWAVFQGIAAFFRMRANPGSSPLPAGFTASAGWKESEADSD